MRGTREFAPPLAPLISSSKGHCAMTDHTVRQKPKNFQDITGSQFACLKVLKFLGSDNRQKSIWLCKCGCGNEIIVPTGSLKSGNTTSCGCIRKQKISLLNKTHGQAGKDRTPEYRSWAHLVERCTNPNNKHYKHYGARGITVCERWHKFENFYADMGKRPSSKHSIERKNNDEGYSKENCKWATHAEQNSNTSKNIIVNISGENMCLKEACSRANLKYITIYNRIKILKWPIGKALNTAIKTSSKLTIMGE